MRFNKPANFSKAETLRSGKTTPATKIIIATKTRIQAIKAVAAGLYSAVPRIVSSLPPKMALKPLTVYVVE